MAPNIPVPTPVTGAPFPKSQVDTLDGARLLVGELHTKYPESFDLFILALYRFQENGHEDFDKDNEDGTSYFQIAGQYYEHKLTSELHLNQRQLPRYSRSPVRKLAEGSDGSSVSRHCSWLLHSYKYFVLALASTLSRSL